MPPRRRPEHAPTGDEAERKVVNVLVGHTPGGILSVYKVLAAFLPEDLPLTLLTFNCADVREMQRAFPGREILDLGVDPPLRGWAALLFVCRICRMAKAKPGEVFVINNLATAILVWLASRIVPLRYLLHIHEPPYPESGRRAGILAAIRHRLLSRALGRADAILCVSGHVQDAMAREFPALRTQLVPNPIPVAEVLASAAGECSLPADGRFRFVSVGRLNRVKGYDTLLEACSRLVNTACRDFEIVIVGDGEERMALETAARELGLSHRVRFVGHTENPYPYIAHANYYVSTSLWEGFGLTIAYAMLLRRPIIASRTGGAMELLGEKALYFDPGDAGALCDRMAAALGGQGDDPAWVQENAEAVLEFEGSRMASRFADVFYESKRNAVGRRAHG